MPKFGSATISSHLNSHQRALAYSICYNQILAIIAEGFNGGTMLACGRIPQLPVTLQKEQLQDYT